jgi:hypothetical protein
VWVGLGDGIAEVLELDGDGLGAGAGDPAPQPVNSSAESRRGRAAVRAELFKKSPKRIVDAGHRLPA